MPGGRGSMFRFGAARSDDIQAITAVAQDEFGVVLLVSPDGRRFRSVERLARTASEAQTLYDAAQTPMLSVEDLFDLYGEHIAKLKLGRV